MLLLRAPNLAYTYLSNKCYSQAQVRPHFSIQLLILQKCVLVMPKMSCLAKSNHFIHILVFILHSIKQPDIKTPNTLNEVHQSILSEPVVHAIEKAQSVSCDQPNLHTWKSPKLCWSSPVGIKGQIATLGLTGMDSEIFGRTMCCY